MTSPRFKLLNYSSVKYRVGASFRKVIRAVGKEHLRDSDGGCTL